MSLLRGRVAATSPLVVVVPAQTGSTRLPAEGWPAHPAGRAPIAGDTCAVSFDELGKLWIVTWGAS